MVSAADKLRIAALTELPSGFPLLDAGKHWPDASESLEGGSGSLLFFLIAEGVHA